MKTFRNLFVAAVILLCLATLAYASIPKVINYQGKFTDKDDNPLSGNYLVTFRFYDSPEDGQPLWEEGHILSLDRGVFNVLLGSIKPLDIDFNRDLWLGIEVGNDGEMRPRIKLASSAYAFNAKAIDMIEASQLVRNDIDNVINGSLTLKKDLILRGDSKQPSKLVLTDKLGKEYYLWVDREGALRFKQGAPSSDNDGRVIPLSGGIISTRLGQSLALFLLIVSITLFILTIIVKKK